MYREIKFRAWDKKKNKIWNIFGIHPDGHLLGYDGNGGWRETHHSKDIILMQFTGLKDKNGKNIYEGDILLYGEMKNEVKYDVELAMYYDIFGLAFSSLAKESEVIGNIYKNKDLLNATL